MKIKVLCLGRSAKELQVQDGTTVEHAIAEAGFPKDAHYNRHVNGAFANDTDLMHDGDVLTLTPNVKGG